jgi:hypothetical protein
VIDQDVNGDSLYPEFNLLKMLTYFSQSVTHYKYGSVNLDILSYVHDLYSRRHCVYIHLAGSKLICSVVNNSYILIHSPRFFFLAPYVLL